MIAAADPSGDPSLVWQAAGQLGIPVQAAAPAVGAGLVEFGSRVRFWHPLMRSAAYRSASFEERQEVHRTLAEITDPQADPDRRAWHRAQAAAGPDEEVAAELERSAGRAQARGGLAAAAAFLDRSVALTVDPARRAERTLAAVQVSMQAGAFGKALELLGAAEGGPLDEFASARADLLRGQLAFASGLGSDAPPLLMKAAKRLEPLDLDLARKTYLDAWIAAMFAGRLAGADDLAEISRAARALPPPPDPPPLADLLLDGLARLVTDGRAAAAPALRQVVSAFASRDVTAEEGLRWGWLAQAAAIVLWDEDGWHAIAVRQTRLARDAGALDQLPIDLASEAATVITSGDFPAGASLIAEADVVSEATSILYPPFAALWLTCLSGNEAEAAPLIESTITEGTAGGQGHAVSFAQCMAAILYNGLGHYAAALAAAQQASEDTLYVSMWALPELIEAAVRSGNTGTASDALERLAETTQAGGTDYGLGLEARSRALLSDGEAANGLYREAIDRLSRARLRPDLARAHLLYGALRRMAAPRGPPRRRPHATPDRVPDAGHHGCRGVRRACPARTAGRRRDGAQARGGDPHRAHPAGGIHRPARAARPHQHGDRRPVVSQRPHGRMAPGQRVHQARNQFAPRTAPGAGAPRTSGSAGVVTSELVIWPAYPRSSMLDRDLRAAVAHNDPAGREGGAAKREHIGRHAEHGRGSARSARRGGQLLRTLQQSAIRRF